MKVRLPLLESFADHVFDRIALDLERITFVCVQHLLETTVELFKSLINLGVPPQHMFLMGKHYSQSPFAIQTLLNLGLYVHPSRPQLKPAIFSEVFKEEVKDFWEHILFKINNKKTEAIVILDDGGFCLANAPASIFDKYHVIGIEQTTAGTRHAGIELVPCPIIQVALSAAKKELESPIIASAVAKRVEDLLAVKRNPLKCGIVGAGSIGQAVAEKLITLGYHTTAYDKEKKEKTTTLLNWSNTIEELIQNNDIIFGCSGTDIFYQLELEHLFNRDKIFVSCSSEDKEFLSLLKWIQKDEDFKFSGNPLQDIFYLTAEGHKIQILRGGFPINFDNIKETEPEKDIQLTRGLLLGAIFQSLICIQEKVGEKYTKYMLDPDIQRYIALNWLSLAYPKNAAKFLDKFSSLEWIAYYSKGCYLDPSIFTEIFLFEEKQAIAV